jgi:hypothetical protein
MEHSQWFCALKGQAMGNYPISKTCPKCGNDKYTKTAAEALISFAPDRICTKCRYRYTPPTPRWAGAVFLICGLAIMGLGAFFVIDHWKNARQPPGVWFHVTTVLCSFLGVAVVIFGAKNLFAPARANDEDSEDA